MTLKEYFFKIKVLTFKQQKNTNTYFASEVKPKKHISVFFLLHQIITSAFPVCGTKYQHLKSAS